MGKLEKMQLKELENFISLWNKFHEIYKKSIKNKIIFPEEEKDFLDTKEVVMRRYQALLGIIHKNPQPDSIIEILNASSITTTSDRAATKTQAGWVHASMMLSDWKKEFSIAAQKRGPLSRFLG